MVKIHKILTGLALWGIISAGAVLCPVWAGAKTEKYTNTDFAMNTVVSETLYTTGKNLNPSVGELLKNTEENLLSWTEEDSQIAALNAAQGKTLEKKGFKLPISGNALVLLIALVLVTAIFSALNPNYFTYGNFINILVSSTLIGLTAIGMTFLIMTGGSDLSAGSVAAFGGVFIAWGLKNTSMNWVLLALIVLAASSVAGIINGLMVTRLNIVPFIATLVSQSLWRGCAYLLCDGRPIAISDAGLKSLGNGMVFGSVPYPVIMTILLFAVFAFVLSSTKFGRSIFAIGGNAEAARLAGINSNRIKIICYVMTSVFAAMAGIILASRMFSGQPAASPNLHFDAITACNLAGVSMVGGVGSIPSVALGVILVQAFNSGLNMAGVSQYWQYVARAALLFGSLAIDFYRQRNRQKKLLADSMKNL